MKQLICILLLSGLICGASGSNLRQISSREGISNNAILSLCQDKHGYIWVGTCDGLNMWDGERMMLYPNDWKKSVSLSGNLIEQIAITTDSLFWIRTNYGLDLFNPEEKSVEKHPQFQGMYKFVTRHSSEVLVLTQDNKLWSYDSGTCKFSQTNIPYALDYDNLLNMTIDAEDNLWIFSRSGISCIPIAFTHRGLEFGISTRISHAAPLEYAFPESGAGLVYFIDTQCTLYEFNTLNRQISYKKEMRKELADMGKLSSIVRDDEDYIISFYTNGVIRLRNTPQSSIKYVTEHINVPCGVFSLLKDTKQDIVWIGSDGQGLYQHTCNDIAFRSITYNDLPYNLSKPVRALHLDNEGTLWVGTKGEGLLRIRNFHTNKEFNKENVELITTPHTALLDNSVYAFARSRRNILWIGGDGDGLNYYSYRERAIRTLKIPKNNELKFIHGLYETDKSTLWAATVGCGVYKIEIGGSDDRPEIRTIQQLYFNEELKIKNFFFALHPESDSIMWFGNRGGGAVRHNIHTGTSEVIKFDRGRSDIANDIFAIYRSRDGHNWFGTSGGLIPFGDDTTVHATNSTVHGILEDSKANLWLSTNRGLVKYTPQNGNAVTYGYSYGLNTIEYSDGAYFSDPKTGILFFGGTNGLVTIEQTPFEEVAYSPPILFRDIRINNNIFSVDNLLSAQGTLILHHGQRIYDLTVSALDYINGSNYTYYSQLVGFDNQWIASTGKLSFADLPAGSYQLNVRYHNSIMGGG